MVLFEEHANVWGMRSKLEDEDMGGLLYVSFRCLSNWDQETETHQGKRGELVELCHIYEERTKSPEREIFFPSKFKALSDKNRRS